MNSPSITILTPYHRIDLSNETEITYALNSNVLTLRYKGSHWVTKYKTVFYDLEKNELRITYFIDETSKITSLMLKTVFSQNQ